MRRVNWSRGGLIPVLYLALVVQAGCVTRLLGLGGEPEVTGSKGSVPISKVERLLDGFAERQVTLIADACEAIKRETPSPDERRRAHHIKLANGTAVYDVVTQPNPLSRIANLYILVELEHLVWVEEGGAEKQFGDRGRNRLMPAVEEAQREMSNLADLAMKPERRRQFDSMIRKWRERNPDVEFVAGISFGALAEAGGKTVLESATSVFDVINPMEDTTQSVERARMLADRAFFYSKRILKLADWQAEAALENTLALPEVRKILADLDKVTSSVEQVTPTIRDLPDQLAKERDALLAAWDVRSKEILGPVREIRRTIVDARELAERATDAGKAFEKTFRALEDVVGKSDKAPEVQPSRQSDDVVGKSEKAPDTPPSHPFDIRDLTAAAAQIKEAAQEGTGLLVTGRSLIDHLAWRGIELLILLLGLLVVYRLVVDRWIRPGPPASRGKDPGRPPTTWESRHGSPT
jgi:hypothetical protein